MHPLKVCKTHPSNLHSICISPHEQKHVVALNKQIVESGGKPLLGKDPSNISRLEWQSEEFLNAVLHSKGEYPAHTVSHCVKMNGQTLCIKVIEMTATFAVARVTGTVKSK